MTSTRSAHAARWLMTLWLSVTLCSFVAAGCGRTAGPAQAPSPASATDERGAGSASGSACGDPPSPSGQRCVQVLGCTLEDCVDRSTNPPSLTLACVANCLSAVCPAAQLFADQMTTCVATNFGTCVGGTSCIENACSVQLSACISATCGGDRPGGDGCEVAPRQEAPR